MAVELSVAAIRDELDRITAFLGIAHDISARRETEGALQHYLTSATAGGST